MAAKVMQRLREWAWVLVLALPVITAYIVADRTSGWVSVTASAFMWAAVAALITIGIAHEFWAWGKVLNDDDQQPPEDVA